MAARYFPAYITVFSLAAFAACGGNSSGTYVPGAYGGSAGAETGGDGGGGRGGSGGSVSKGGSLNSGGGDVGGESGDAGDGGSGAGAGGSGGNGGAGASAGSGGSAGIGGNLIGVDGRHGFPYDPVMTFVGDDADSFRDAIVGEGYAIKRLSRFQGEDLVGLRAVILNVPYTGGTSIPAQGFTAEEIAAVIAFVEAGGGLLIHGDAGSGNQITNVNLIAANWGVTFAGQIGGSGEIVSGFVTHPVTAGIVSFGMDYHAEITTVGPAMDLVSGTVKALAASEGVGSEGNVVFLGDTSMWFDPEVMTDYNIDSLDNRALLSNILAFIAP